MIVLKLDALAFGGEAVGREPSGRVVFVAGGAPGDLVEVRLVEEKRSFARGELVRVIEAGARIAPPCPLAGECGGCPWQHVTPEAQLAAKQEIVRRALEGVPGIEVRQIVAAPAWLGYRARARMTARGGAVGFLARRSHRVVPVESCVALEPALDQAMAAGRRALGAALGEGGTLSGRVAPDGTVQLAIEPGERADRRALDAAARRLVEDTRAAAGAARIAGDGGTSGAPRAGGSRIVGVTVRGGATHGQALLDVGEGLAGSAAGFAQANPRQNDRLRELVLDEALPSRATEARPRLLELYAGDGNFTRDLVRAATVVAVESDRAAAARLERNLRGLAPSGGWSVRAEPTAAALRSLAAERRAATPGSPAAERPAATPGSPAAPFEVVVLDPPRAGAADAVDGIAALEPARIVYVSCDPMTLARDLRRFAALGYATVGVQPVDMMPHTSHVEVVALLIRASTRE